MLHGVGGGAAERRHGGVIQVDQALADRKVVSVLLPEWGFVTTGRLHQRICVCIGDHSLYNTLRSAIGAAARSCGFA